MSAEARAKVQDYIAKHFDTAAVTLKPIDWMPGGVIVQDKNGDEMLVWWDFVNDTIKTDFPKKGRFVTRNK